ncbi:hypothetical protein [Streptomyces sp. AK010]|uniref:hypothetical protein n=1 Tax=Streptomyces sp. AK010 TaxID=2723074 RepID=UPI0017F3A54F|nr:hypothetical protein [Streptomyces sp. AK010]MBB6415552.1 hypothetical protein [Streptomyces sp. AK010]
MKLAFEDRQTGDSVKDAILADNERAVSTVWQAVASGDLAKSGIGFYYTDAALTGVYNYAKDNNARKTSWAGTLRYFDRQVTVFDKTSAALTYCVDESKANVKDLKTDKVKVVETSPDSYVYYNASVKRDKQGVWQIWKLHEDRGAQRCQP